MIRGQRFELDLGEDEGNTSGDVAARLPGSFVGDVLERKPAAPKPPRAPTLKNKTGFPEHRPRNLESRFKQQRTNDVAGPTDEETRASTSQATPRTKSIGGSSTDEKSTPLSWADEERIRIDQENRQRIADMSPAQVDAERRELMESLSPSFLQKLLMRANIDSGSAEQDLTPPSYEGGPKPDAQNAEPVAEKPPKTMKSVSFADSQPNVHTSDDKLDNSRGISDSHTDPTHAHQESHGDDLGDQSAENVLPPSTDSLHFPQPQQPPSLDPASATFFEDLHSKYFPSLPADPAKLSWMQPATAAENAAYAPDAPALAAGNIRFDFAGALIPPRLAAEIPVSAGLHHHADAPEAAGYTVAELAHLARSTVPAQRCIAFQTLGRVLYRLGRGEFGNPSAENVVAEDGVDEEERGPDPAAFSELAQGLWREVERCQVIAVLVAESEGRGVDAGRHVSAKAYATEAVWLWRKGGGRRWKAA